MITSTVHTLSTSAEKIVDAVQATATSKIRVVLSEPSADIHVGGVGVTTALGTKVVATTGTLTLDLGPGDDLYAIAASGTPTVRVLTVGSGYVAP
jgi:hypothetical protein